jgi:SAM-dependent methyltransferase
VTDSQTEPQDTMWLEAQLRGNRFLPVPPPDLRFCGDGDFRAIGAEFLTHFRREADLRPNDRVLDIGCGIGRMAVPLTQYLSGDGEYTGIDIVRDGIEWCQRTITPVYPNFHFRHLDLQHPLYNPTGVIDAASVRFPFPDATFDFICLVSVFTHITADVLLNYAREVGRLLAPGGRCFATAFLVNPPARAALRGGDRRIMIEPDAEGPEFHAAPATPMAAVGYDEDFFVEKFMRFGRLRRRPAIYGGWSGRHSAVFQDICVFE